MGCSSSSSQNVAQEGNRPGTKPQAESGDSTLVSHDGSSAITDQLRPPVQVLLPAEPPDSGWMESCSLSAEVCEEAQEADVELAVEGGDAPVAPLWALPELITTEPDPEVTTPEPDATPAITTFPDAPPEPVLEVLHISTCPADDESTPELIPFTEPQLSTLTLSPVPELTHFPELPVSLALTSETPELIPKLEPVELLSPTCPVDHTPHIILQLYPEEAQDAAVDAAELSSLTADDQQAHRAEAKAEVVPAANSPTSPCDIQTPFPEAKVEGDTGEKIALVTSEITECDEDGGDRLHQD